MLLDSRTQKLLAVQLIVSNNLKLSEADIIASEQSTQHGYYPMSPAEIDIIPGLYLSVSELEGISDTIEMFFEEDIEEYVNCPICFQSISGTIEECGIFIQAHRAFHRFEANCAPMYCFENCDHSEEE